jgi:hypothetical protein
VEFIIPMFLNPSTCLERHTAHNQELKTVIAATNVVKPEAAAITVFELLMMSGME